MKSEIISFQLYAKDNGQNSKTVFTTDEEFAYVLMEGGNGKDSRKFDIFVETLMILPEYIRLVYDYSWCDGRGSPKKSNTVTDEDGT